jgi:hypothetical protein
MIELSEQDKALHDEDMERETSLRGESYAVAYLRVFNNFHFHFLFDGYRKGKNLKGKSPAFPGQSPLAASQTYSKFYENIDDVSTRATRKSPPWLHDQISLLLSWEWTGGEAEMYRFLVANTFTLRNIQRMSKEEAIAEATALENRLKDTPGDGPHKELFLLLRPIWSELRGMGYSRDDLAR